MTGLSALSRAADTPRKSRYRRKGTWLVLIAGGSAVVLARRSAHAHGIEFRSLSDMDRAKIMKYLRERRAWPRRWNGELEQQLPDPERLRALYEFQQQQKPRRPREKYDDLLAGLK